MVFWVESELRRSHWDSLVLKMGAESQTGEEYIYTNVRIPQMISNIIHFTLWGLTFLYIYNYLVYGNMPHYLFYKTDSTPIN